MRRFLSLFTMLMLCGVLAFAQTRVVSGKITDADGNPISFATIKIKGSNVGLSADATGAFTIKVKAGDVLVISGTGFKTEELAVGSQTVVNAVLDKGTTSELKEVVVTGAFGTKRSARSTASNVQNLSGDQVNTIRQTNVNNALAGKVAGVQVRSQSAAKLGAETAVRLRGENGLLGGGGALYVVDGTLMTSTDNNGRTVNSSVDINPDDVEDYTILQGPAAAALFGPDGKNGAIVINLKKARKGAKGIGVEINTGVQYDKVYITPEYQNSYAGGASESFIQYNYQPGQPEGWKALDGKYYHDYTDDASWGPKMSGQEYIPWYAWYAGSEYSFKTTKLTAQPNNIRDYWETGVTKTNNVNFTKATDNMNMRVSYTNLDIKGITPTEFLKKNTLSANLTMDLSRKLILGLNLTYVAEDRNTEADDGYSNQTSGSFGSWFHRNLDMGIMRELRGLRSPEGILGSWNHGNPTSYSASNPLAFYGNNYWYNFYGYFDNVRNDNRRDRVLGDISLTYKFSNDFKFKATYRKQQVTDNREVIYTSDLENSGLQVSFNPFQGNGKAYYGTRNTFSNRQNYEGIFTYNKKFKDFNIEGNAGFDILKDRFRGVFANTMGGLSTAGLYSLSNSKDPINYTNPRVQFARRSLFIRASAGFRNYLFVEGTYRRDYTSAEPKGSYINSKSGGMSFVFSDLTKSTIPFISYGKIRASIGQLLDVLNPYQLTPTFGIGVNQWNGNILTSVPNNLVDPNLRGATNTEKEIGLEMRFLKNRIGFNVSYWDRTNKNFPVQVSPAAQSGYSLLDINAGEVAKKGWEVSAFIKPVVSKNLDWEITTTWGYLTKNEIVSIAPGILRLNVDRTGAFSGSSSAYLVNEVGQPWGQLFGGGIKRVNGVPEVDANGLFVRQADTKFGSALPQYTGGVQNTFNVFKNFTINVNIDYSYGGKFFSLSDFWGTFSGLTARTAALNDKGNSVRDKVEDGGGVHVIGVDGTGKAVDQYVDAQTYFHQFRNNNISENSVYDLTFVKLRELSVGYKLPVDKLGMGKYLRTAVFSITSRNPWLIYTKSKGFDPSEISNIYGEDGQLPGTRSIGVNLKLGF
jgi:TonB-linked SusC/RagA family outer membrane protein